MVVFLIFLLLVLLALAGGAFLFHLYLQLEFMSKPTNTTTLKSNQSLQNN